MAGLVLNDSQILPKLERALLRIRESAQKGWLKAHAE